MNSQTARRPSNNKRPARSAQGKRYTRQTAHVEARRDGQPLIFGWGSHLSRHEKNILQRRAIWSVIALITALIVFVIVYSWINNNIIVPNQPITAVNGQSIPQSDYHKLVALKGQIESNTLNGVHGLIAQGNDLNKQITKQQSVIDSTTKQIADLKKKIAALPAGTSTQRTDLETQLSDAQKKHDDAQKQHDSLNTQYQNLQKNSIPLEQQRYTQSQMASDSITWLQDDIIIRNWLAKQSTDIQNKINPTDAAVNRALNDFKANLPKGRSYDQFLSSDSVSDSDMHAMMALVLRRNNMQDYQASLITSPTKQVRVRTIVFSTQKDANAALAQLKKSDTDFAKIASQKSVDSTTKSKGGEIGWLAHGQYTNLISQNVVSSGHIDNWLFDPARKVNDISPVLTENGTFHIMQIEEIDPSRKVDDATLKALQGDQKNQNAVTTWLLMQKALPGVTIGQADSNMEFDAMNMPQEIPASAPVTPTPGASGGLPGSAG